MAVTGEFRNAGVASYAMLQFGRKTDSPLSPLDQGQMENARFTI
jgi:hypothetical protein